MSRESIFEEINVECEKQEDSSGHTLNDWIVNVSVSMSQAVLMNSNKAGQRRNLLKAAVLLVATLEEFDHNPLFTSSNLDENSIVNNGQPYRVTPVNSKQIVQQARRAINNLLSDDMTASDLVNKVPRMVALLQGLRAGDVKQSEVAQ